MVWRFVIIQPDLLKVDVFENRANSETVNKADTGDFIFVKIHDLK